MIAKQRQIRISPKKANLVAALVRRKNALEAMEILKFTPKKAAPILYKLIESAVANAAHNSKKSKETLVIDEILVSDGPTYKRRNPVSRGRAHPILKRTSHIIVRLAEVASDAKAEKPKAEVKEAKTEKAEETKEKAAKPEAKKSEVKSEETKSAPKAKSTKK